MMLAGLPAVGKSTMLRQALEEGQALFGEDTRNAFLQTRPPPLATENERSLEQRLKDGNWLHEADLVDLQLGGMRPSRMVVHFDLYSMLRVACSSLRPYGDTFTPADLAALLQDDRRVEGLFRDVFGLLPLAGSQVVVKILKPAYAVTRQRWLSRARQPHAGRPGTWAQFAGSHIYNGQPQGEQLYERIYADWQRALKVAVSA